jgi:hypothetical protein
VVLTGWILDVTGHQWGIVWILASAFYLIGSGFFVAWAGDEIIVE